MRRHPRTQAPRIIRAVAGVVATVALAAGACIDPPAGAGPESSTRIIAVDLPFEGGAADVSEDTFQALQLYLKQVNFAAGPYRIELVRRDNSTPPKGVWSETSCRANAEEHVRTAGQVAVIGTYNSGCTKAELPVLNQAEDGPMLIVSHANTSLGLTGPGEEGEPDRYYPTGLRSFARVIATEAGQGTAAASFAADELEAERCLVLNDGDRYGMTVAAAFAAEARRLGIEVLEETWQRADLNYVGLFSRARVADPDCVFLGGAFDSNGARLVQDKVAILGDNEDVALIAPDGFVGYPDFTALPEADGAYLTFPGLTTETLTVPGSAAERFVAAFAAEYGYEPRGGYASYPLYAVQALQVVLAAIAQSDGTRRGVRDAVFAGAGITIPADEAILGEEVTIDPATGDVVAPGVSILRVQDMQGHLVNAVRGKGAPS